MAGRVPLGTDRAAVAGEMETIFIENLRYAADLLSQVSGEWVLLCVCSSQATQDGEGQREVMLPAAEMTGFSAG